jgi:hypothetical protein
MTDASNLAGLVEKVNEIRDATPAEWDAARAYVARTAPDQRVRLERGLRGAR